MKRRIAVLFGGRSPEHDVSVVTALQAMNALDSQKYEVIPIYITTAGEWLTGRPLLRRESYIPSPTMSGLRSAQLDIIPRMKPRLLLAKTGLISKSASIEFDVALLAFHGLVGEDGCIQGLMESAGVPYTGMRLLASAILMDKVVTKHILASTSIPALPYREIRRPVEGTYVPPEILEKQLSEIRPPYCIKPSHLGSSIGVGRAEDMDSIAAMLTEIFVYDSSAIVEPFVPNMVEYNVAVTYINGQVVTSAIEKPLRAEELLDFKQKYLSSDGTKTNGKQPGQSSEGLLSLTREMNPKLPANLEQKIRAWSVKLFECVYGTGAPRIDYICNQETSEIWLNEVNPCPGSFGYFLWEASRDNHILFSDLLDKLIDEALAQHSSGKISSDPVPVAARLLSRKTS